MEPSNLSVENMNVDSSVSFSSSSARAISAITSAIEASSNESPTETPTFGSPQRKKLKRNRIVLSCLPCHRRKQQCDRGQPCQRCIKRGLQKECSYGQPPKRQMSDDSQGDGLPGRVAQLETLVQNTLGGMEPAALAGLDALLQLVQASNAITAPTTSSADPAIADHAVQVAAAALGQLSQQGLPGEPPAPGPISEILNHIRRAESPQFPSAPSTLADLRTHFPNHVITTYLLRHYFETSSIHWLWGAAIHRPMFDNFYLAFSSGPHPQSLDFVALLAIVCASALQFLPETDQDVTIFSDYRPGRHVLRKRLFDFARSVLISSESTPFPSIERIQALILLALYQENAGNIIEYCNVIGAAVKMAQSLAMNRDGLTAWSMKPFDAELRRRVWWNLFTLDRFQCMKLRRPYMILEQHCDVAMPLNLDQLELADIPDLQGKPLDQPTEQTFHILQIRWAQIIGRLWDQCFSIRVPTYRAIVDIEDEIRRFELELPASFCSQSMQGALARPYLLFQNQFLTLQIYHMRAILLRPFLFIRPAGGALTGQEEKMATYHRHAKSVCLVFCKRILALLQLIPTQVHRHQLRWSDLVLRAFEPAMMLAISIIMDPSDSQNEDLNEWIAQAQNLLQSFGTYNTIAPNAVAGLEVIRKRVQLALHPQSQSSPDASSSAPSGAPSTVAHPIQYIERSTRTLSLPQPSISDLLGQKDLTDPLWNTAEAVVYTGNFPGIEFLCGHAGPETLEIFFDNCAPR